MYDTVRKSYDLEQLATIHGTAMFIRMENGR
jgi:hypothetical protein